MKLTTMKVQALCIFVLVLVVGTSSQKYADCPFHNLYHFGDTSTDIGNAIRIKPWGPHLPAAHLPFGKTDPGYPTGRWSDGYIDFDYTACYYGLPHIVPYLGMNGSSEYDGVIFSVAWSPVLDRSFFKSRGVEIPPYVASLNEQLAWFKDYLNTVESTPEGIAKRLKDSVLFTGDLEGNDVIYGLTQGKSIEEVKTYVPYITETMINAIRELLLMGADKILVPGNFPIGCTPYMLTELKSDNPDDYDDIGCLDTVNQLIKYKNKDLEEAIKNTIQKEFPDALVLYEDGYSFVEQHIRDAISKGLVAFKSCCGVGGKYNYDSKRFCGHPEATVCSNPSEYVWWDGFHDTAATYYSIVSSLIDNALTSLNCTKIEPPTVDCTKLESSSALKSLNYMKLEPSSASM